MYQDHTDNRPAITTARFAAILGLAPSRGARSPLLWNAAFAAAGMDAAMVAMDVSAARLAPLIAALKGDPRFLGGAVTVPHKQAVAACLDRLEPEAARIGAVNAIWRDGEALVGANTDGAAALAQIEARTGPLAGRRAVLLGLGGAGLAVAAYLAPRLAGLVLANRTPARAEAAARRLGGPVTLAPLPPPAGLLAGADLLVNCTSAGHAGGDPGTALGAGVDALLAALPAHALVYDIIYQPAETELLARARARGLATLNGLGMNLDQAVIAFARANPGGLDLAGIRAAMAAAG